MNYLREIESNRTTTKRKTGSGYANLPEVRCSGVAEVTELTEEVDDSEEEEDEGEPEVDGGDDGTMTTSAGGCKLLPVLLPVLIDLLRITTGCPFISRTTRDMSFVLEVIDDVVVCSLLPVYGPLPGLALVLPPPLPLPLPLPDGRMPIELHRKGRSNTLRLGGARMHSR